jgi:4a-hydroxytetrahydrobiopterin dehydratase
MKIKGWKIKNRKLHKEFKFKDFKETLKFVNKVGKAAEKQGHHPNIYFTWGRCIIDIYTHSIKGLSEKDFALASRINKIK